LSIGAPGATGISRDRFLEVPLREWRDVGGSHLKSRDMARAGLDLVRIQRALLVWQRRTARR